MTFSAKATSFAKTQKVLRYVKKELLDDNGGPGVVSTKSLSSSLIHG